jgi:hypothetical protein
MKTSRILFIGLLFIGMNMQAQEIYIRAGLGAAVSTAANIVLDANSSSTSSTLTSKKAGLGTGLPFVLAPGYRFNEHFGVELGINYFYGFTIKGKNENSYSGSEKKYHGQMLSLVPAFIMTFSVDKIHPYARLGLILGVMNSVVYKSHETYNPELKAATMEIDSKDKDYGGIAIGAQAALGTDYAISDKISLFGEIQVDGISYAPKHGKYLEYSQNGVDVMGDRTVKQNKWDYKKEIDFTQTMPDDQPDQVARVNHRFGNVGLVIGVKFNFK